MRSIKSFFLNLRDINDTYIRKNFEKLENKINQLEAKEETQATQTDQSNQTTSSGTNLQTSNQSENTIARIPIESISALKAVKSTGPINVAKASPTGTYEDAIVLGVAIQTGFVGVKTTIKIFGELKDPFFNFPLHDDLYLSSDGAITNVAPSTERFQTQIGYSLGQGAIFIDTKPPIQIN